MKQEKANTISEKQLYDHRESIMLKSNSPIWIRQKCPPLGKITAREGLENYVPFWSEETEEDSRQRGQRSQLLKKDFCLGKKKNGTIYQRKTYVFERKRSKIQL